MQRLIFDQGYALPPEQVFDYFAEHENLPDLFGAKITRLKNGTTATATASARSAS